MSPRVLVASSFALASLALAVACSSSGESASNVAASDAGVDAQADVSADVTSDANADGSDAVDASSDAPLDANSADGDASVLPDNELDAGAIPDGSLCDPSMVDGSVPTYAYTPLSSGSWEQDKAFYLGTVLAETPALLASIDGDATLSASSMSHDGEFRQAVMMCGQDASCWSSGLTWADTDVDAIAEAFAARLEATGDLATLTTTHLRPSGMFALFANGTDHDLARQSMADLLRTLGAVYGQYATELGAAMTASTLTALANGHASPFRFWEPLLQADLAILNADSRDEATLYEPVDDGENAAALARVSSVDFEAYPFSVIVVPGEGPSSLSVEFSPVGQGRCDLAAARFHLGLAPFLLTSGGHVHPDRTPYCEALEMKHYLMSAHGIPEDSIFVDPFARHTTTNVRNAAREIIRYGLSPNRPALITSDIFQAAYIAPGGPLGPRCTTDLGYQPWTMMVQQTATDSCFLPSLDALFAAGSDPLDP